GGFGTFTQLSQRSPTPSASASACVGSATVGQSSIPSGTPSPSESVAPAGMPPCQANWRRPSGAEPIVPSSALSERQKTGERGGSPCGQGEWNAGEPRPATERPGGRWQSPSRGPSPELSRLRYT